MMPFWKTGLILCTIIGAFLFIEDIDRREEWLASSELKRAQQEEQAKQSRNAIAIQVCGPGAESAWKDSVLTCTPKRGKPYQIAIE